MARRRKTEAGQQVSLWKEGEAGPRTPRQPGKRKSKRKRPGSAGVRPQEKGEAITRYFIHSRHVEYVREILQETHRKLSTFLKSKYC